MANTRVRVVAGIGEGLSGLWGLYSAFTTAADLPEDAGKFAKMMADPPIYLPWLIAAAFFIALAWAFWPSRSKIAETVGIEEKPEDAAPAVGLTDLILPVLPAGTDEGSITTRVSDPNTLRLRAETGSTIDFTGATIKMDNPSIQAHASGGSTVSFEGANIGPHHHHHHGKMPFEMTEAVMAGLLRQINGQLIRVWAIGSTKSTDAVSKLSDFLVANGVSVIISETGALAPPLAANIEWRDGCLYVNADI